MIAKLGLQLTFKRSFYNKDAPRQALKASAFAPRAVLFVAGIIGAGTGYFYIANSRSAIHEYFFCPLLRLVTPDPEEGHKLGIWLLKNGLAPKLFFDRDPESLHVNVFGKTMTNPIGCAAGLDKNAEAVDGILSGGFGYMEIGSVTPLPQPGNPKPRFFRLPKDQAVINRYGFNSDGHETICSNLGQRVSQFLGSYSTNKKNVQNLSLHQHKLLAINLGKNKKGDEIEDYIKGIEKFQSLADVLVINVSSPNTPGLRNMQAESKLAHLLTEVVSKRDSLTEKGDVLGHKFHRPPILVKIAPDLSEPELQSIVEASKKSKIDGIIVSNTTIQRPRDLITDDPVLTNQVGGLSGKPLKPLSLKALKTVAKYSKGSDLILVGCGGISSGKDAIEFAKAGATFVQLYTAYAYSGPGLIAKIKDEVTEELRKEGKTWMEIIGQDN